MGKEKRIKMLKILLNLFDIGIALVNSPHIPILGVTKGSAHAISAYSATPTLVNRMAWVIILLLSLFFCPFALVAHVAL